MLNVRRLERAIEEQMDRARVPGLALCVVLGGDILYAGGFGVTSVEDGSLPVTPRTIFRIGSLTKAFTATAVLRLVDRGDLDLDAPVHRYVPWLRLADEEAAQVATLRMLLSHASGLGTAAEERGRRGEGDLERFVREELPEIPFAAPPGLLYSYSNAGAILAGYVVEVVAGRPFARAMEDLVFSALGMERTTFDVTVAMTYPLAQSHTLGEDGVLRVQHTFADSVAHAPAGLAMSTADDMARFVAMLASSGRANGSQFLSPASAAAMQSPQVEILVGPGVGYGLGLGVGSYKGLPRVGHRGAISTFASHLEVLPESGAGVFLVHNRASEALDTGRIIWGIVDELLGLPAETPAPAPVEPDRSLWPLFRGTYVGALAGMVTIEVGGSALIAAFGGRREPLDALQPNLYVARDASAGRRLSVGFVPNGDRPVEYVVVNGQPARRTDAPSAFQAQPDEWADFQGIYRGMDRITVTVRDDTLFVHSSRLGRELPCQPLGPARFSCPFGLLEFRRDERGRVVELVFGEAYVFRKDA